MVAQLELRQHSRSILTPPGADMTFHDVVDLGLRIRSFLAIHLRTLVSIFCATNIPSLSNTISATSP